MICYFDWILLFRLMQNRRKQLDDIKPPSCRMRNSHLHVPALPCTSMGILPSRGKWLYHLYHPSGSGADTANLLHVFNVAHAKPWSHASILQVSPTDIPTAAAVAAVSVLTPGWTSPLQQPANPPVSRYFWPLPAKTELSALRLPFLSPAKQVITCQDHCRRALGSHWTAWVGCIV